MEIRRGGLDHPLVAALVRHHREEARSCTPCDNAHALDDAGLASPDITFFAAWEGEVLLGIGAIKQLAPDHCELKSMRTAPAHLRRGVGRAMLAHLVGFARAHGCRRVSLETGTAPMFAAASRMYEGMGFVDGPAFAGYPASPHNRFMTLSLEELPECPRLS